MILRSLALSLCALLLCAADDLPPPPQLEPYIKDGRFDPGDFGWMKGRFADATAEEKESYAAIDRWFDDCQSGQRAGLKARLDAAGYPEANVEGLLPDPLRCRLFGQPFLEDTSSFAAFQRELAAVRPIADTYLATVGIAEESSRPSGREPDLARQLQARTIGEQVLRRAFTWSNGVMPNSPSLSPVGRSIFQARVLPAMTIRDHANTEWLKGVIEQHGWPTISLVGAEASNNAWLLVQHADNDPEFQLAALRLMVPLVPQGEVSKQNYAYLHDRIMLRLAGKQRYATQMTCRDGKRQPQPLESEADVDRLRQEVGLDTLQEYMATMDRAFGPCPPSAPSG